MKLKFITKADHLTALAKKVFNGIEPIDDCHARVWFMNRDYCPIICRFLTEKGMTPVVKDDCVEFAATGCFIEFVTNEVFRG